MTKMTEREVIVNNMLSPHMLTVSLIYVLHFANCSQVIAFPSRNGKLDIKAEMHGRAHITDSCFIAFITSKIC